MKRIPKLLKDAEFEPLWRETSQFSEYGLRLVPKRSRKTSHRAGGPTNHKGSDCPNCKKPLTTLWDLDLTDPSLPDRLRETFSPNKRLPFLICWQCLAASYRVTSDKKLTCFKFDGYTDYLELDESPFEDAPSQLKQRSIVFEDIPTTLAALLAYEQVKDFSDFDDQAKSILNDFYGRELYSTWQLPFSQIGGTPLLYQRHQNAACPNRECPARSIRSPNSDYYMQELAVIHHDDEPVLDEHCIQLLYYICGICASMRAEYRCS